MYPNNFYLSELYKTQYQNDDDGMYSAGGLASRSNTNTNALEFSSYPTNRSNFYFNDHTLMKNGAIHSSNPNLMLAQQMAAQQQQQQPMNTWNRNFKES